MSLDELDILFKDEADPYTAPAAMFLLSEDLCLELGVHNIQIRHANIEKQPNFQDKMPRNLKTWRELNGDGALRKARPIHTMEELTAARAEVSGWFQNGLERTWFVNATTLNNKYDTYVFNNDFLQSMQDLKTEGKLPELGTLPTPVSLPKVIMITTARSIRRPR